MAQGIGNFIDRIQIGTDDAHQIAIGSSAYAVCTTAANTAAKEVNIPGFALNTGTTIHIKFNNANSASNPTLNVSGTGAKAIMQYGTTNTGTAEETSGWRAGAIVTLTYDGTNWVRDQGYNTNSWRGIQNNLTSDSTTDSLSAAQGKELKRQIDLKTSNTGTVTKISTGAGLTGGDITTSGTIKANLTSETKLTNAAADGTETSGQVYPVRLDKNGKLAVNVPWTNVNSNYLTGVGYDSTNKKIYYTKNGSNTDVVTFGSNAFNSTSYLPLSGGTMNGTARIVWADSGSWGSSGATFPNKRGGLYWSGTSDWIDLFAEETASDKLNLVINFGDDTNPSLVLRDRGTDTITLTASSGNITATTFTGSGASLTSLNASNISSGTLAIARIADSSITNAKLANSKVTIASNDVNLGGSLAADTLTESLGLSKAMHFIGIATVAITDGGTENPTISGYDWSKKQAGDVVIDKDSSLEYVWSTTNKWERLGGDSSYKTTQTAVTKPTAATNKWVSTIGQNANGVIDVSYTSLDTTGSWTGKITRAGISTSWNKGRDNALIWMSALNGYSPAVALKTKAGSWDIGTYDNNNYQEDLIFSYVPDTLYNGTNTTPTQIKFLENGHIIGALDGNASTATTSTWATLIKPIASTTTASASTWSIPSGSYQVWGERFSDTRLKYTPSGGSESTVTDTGDWTMWLTGNGTTNTATLNMRIDGTYYGSFSGNLSGNASTATKFNSTRKIELTGAVTGSATTDGSSGWTIATTVNHTHSYITSRGNITCETGGNKPAQAGLSMSQVYNNGYPTTYGNVLTMYGSGASQLLIGWSGSSSSSNGVREESYIRSQRDTAGSLWSTWEKILTSGNTTAPSSVPTLSWNTESTIFTLGGTAVKIKAMTKPTYAFTDLTSHPTTLSGYGITDAASSSHSHTLKIGNKSLSVNTSEQTWALHDILKTSTNIGTDTSWDQYEPGVYYVASNAAFTGTNNPENANTNNGIAPYRYGQLIVSRADTGGVAEFYISHHDSNNASYGIHYRTGWNNTYVAKWSVLLDSHNYTNYTVTKTGTGASGSWGISITGTAAKATADASGNTITSTYATKTEMNGLLAAADAMIFKGTLGTNGTITTLPAAHNAGDTYRVITAGTWAGKYCEVGTLIICIKDGTTAADADWTSVETNEDGAVIGPAGTNSSTDNAIARWDGTSGRIVQNSTATINDSGTMNIKGKLIVNPSYDTSNNYNEGIRINSGSNGWAELLLGGDADSTSGTSEGAWLLGRRGLVSINGGFGAVGDFTIEEQNSIGVGLTLHKDSGGISLYVDKAKNTGSITIKNVNALESNAYQESIFAMTPNMVANSNNILLFGKANSTKNSAYIGFNWQADSSNNNCLILGLASVDQIIKIYGSGQTSITTNTDSSSTTTGSFIVAGGVGIAKTLYVGTGVHAGNITIGGTVDTNAGKTISSNSTLYLNRATGTSIIFQLAGTNKIWIDTDNAFRPETTNTLSLGTSSYRWGKIYVGTADTHGDAYTPIYWNDGVPAAVTLIQYCEFTIGSGKTGVKLAHAAFTAASYVTQIVVTDGESNLNSAIAWESAAGYINLTCSAITSGAVSGYILVSRGGAITATATDIT